MTLLLATQRPSVTNMAERIDKMDALVQPVPADGDD